LQANRSVISLAEKWTAEIAEPFPEQKDMPGWLADLRQAGAAAFAKYGLPHRKVEDWKYTSLKLLEARSHRLMKDGGTTSLAKGLQWPNPLVEDEYTALRLLNGRLETDFTAPGGVEILSLDDALAADEHQHRLKEMLESLPISGPARAFSALNTSMLGEGIVIRVPAGIDGGNVLLQWSFDDQPPAMMFNSRVVIFLEEGASLTLVEQFESEHAGAHALNLVSQATIGKGATLRHIRVQQEPDDVALITRSECDVHQAGEYQSSSFDFGGGLVRHDSPVRLHGAGAKGDVNGAFMLAGSRHLDHHVFVDHVGGESHSSQFFRGVLGDRSRGVFNGKARICQGADGSTIRQSNANLLLSPLAEINTKPELEIYADEVEASHGATVGQLDEDTVFYMRSRGLDETQARALLTSAFCKAVLDQTTDLPASLVKEIANRMDSAMSELVGSRTAPSALPG
jgi:Fe-S cluster assembly protein SufD